MSVRWVPARGSGKVEYVQRRLELDGFTIIVSSEKNRLELLATAKRLGVEKHIEVVSTGKAKPWIDARPTSKNRQQPFAISKEMIEKAMLDMGKLRMVPRYIYRISATGKALLPYLHYFAGSGVVVVDGKGGKWLNGKPYKENIY